MSEVYQSNNEVLAAVTEWSSFTPEEVTEFFKDFVGQITWVSGCDQLVSFPERHINIIK